MGITSLTTGRRNPSRHRPRVLIPTFRRKIDACLKGTSNNCHQSSGAPNLPTNDSALFSFRFRAVHPKDVRDCQLRQLFEVPLSPDTKSRANRNVALLTDIPQMYSGTAETIAYGGLLGSHRRAAQCSRRFRRPHSPKRRLIRRFCHFLRHFIHIHSSRRDQTYI